MNKLYQKSPLGFALLWIGLYVVLLSVADDLSRSLGVEKLVTAPLCVLMVAILCLWIGKNGLRAEFGLCGFAGRASDYLYFLPLVLLASTNLWNGVTLNYPPGVSALYAGSMLCVGWLEEVIFRGLLFRALCRENVKRAVVISSLTFGLGHIVNLLNGAELAPTLLQICYACAIGFLFTIIFYKSGSLWPCIVTHSAINSLSTFAVERSQTMIMIAAAALTVVSIAYALVLMKRQGKSCKQDGRG